MKFLNKIKNLFLKIKTIDLDNDGKIETLRAEIEGVFFQFKRMDDKLDEVNEKLAEIKEEELRKASLAEKRAEKANLELQANKKLQERVKDFIL